MKIDKLIKQLTALQKAGAKEVSIVDSNYNDYEIEAVEPNNGNLEVLIQVAMPEGDMCL